MNSFCLVLIFFFLMLLKSLIYGTVFVSSTPEITVKKVSHTAFDKYQIDSLSCQRSVSVRPKSTSLYQKVCLCICITYAHTSVYLTSCVESIAEFYFAFLSFDYALELLLELTLAVCLDLWLTDFLFLFFSFLLSVVLC